MSFILNFEAHTSASARRRTPGCAQNVGRTTARALDTTCSRGSISHSLMHHSSLEPRRTGV
ncbi:hypothetical protein EXIGLDRAFT_734049 [Exidia glandulosa HHB12029]|uniref:Uncharacterized protein n=1 Tax=Exidia glandulosa HHB12029 TaxID=1314781 RepID=A0A165Z6P5_EXIGL|nr:hypothetical protein EXIGLDRAFT_734049 [Exidia glandulosa HHB12029]